MPIEIPSIQTGNKAKDVPACIRRGIFNHMVGMRPAGGVPKCCSMASTGRRVDPSLSIGGERVDDSFNFM